jgi:hypothetical protein
LALRQSRSMHTDQAELKEERWMRPPFVFSVMLSVEVTKSSFKSAVFWTDIAVPTLLLRTG